MTEEQSLRQKLLEKAEGNIVIATSWYRFIMFGDNHEASKNNNKVMEACHHIEDGVYEVYADGTFAPHEDGKCGCNCVGIAIVQGKRSLVVSLQDVSDDEITLTDGKDNTNATKFYIDKPYVAVANWSGKENTEHIKEIGLNPAIKLEENEYIPSLGELYFMFTHLLELNKALADVGGDPIRESWYWSSTECSAAYAWCLFFSNGSLFASTKATLSYYVRPVSAFQGTL